MTAPILIMAGGTGGHVFPALAVARELRGRDEVVVWLGTQRGIEADIVPKEGFPLEWTRVSGLRGKGLLSWLLAPLKLGVAVCDAVAVLIRRRPKLVLGMGGFASGPGGFAAWLLRKPLIIRTKFCRWVNKPSSGWIRPGSAGSIPGQFFRQGAGASGR